MVFGQGKGFHGTSLGKGKGPEPASLSAGQRQHQHPHPHRDLHPQLQHSQQLLQLQSHQLLPHQQGQNPQHEHQGHQHQHQQLPSQESAPPGQAPKDLSAPAPAWKSLLLPELPEATQDADLSKAVGQIPFMHTKGKVESVHIVRGQKDTASYAFVNFATHEAAAHCFQASQQQLLVLLDRGRKVAVKALWAKNGARRFRKAVRGQKAVR